MFYNVDITFRDGQDFTMSGIEAANAESAFAIALNWARQCSYLAIVKSKRIVPAPTPEENAKRDAIIKAGFVDIRFDGPDMMPTQDGNPFDHGRIA